MKMKRYAATYYGREYDVMYIPRDISDISLVGLQKIFNHKILTSERLECELQMTGSMIFIQPKIKRLEIILDSFVMFDDDDNIRILRPEQFIGRFLLIENKEYK